MSQRLLILMLLLSSDPCLGSLFQVKKMECKSLDVSFSYFKKCEFNAKDQGRSAINIYAAVRYSKPIDDVKISLNFFKLSRSQRFQILNETIDFCRYMSQPWKSGLLGKLMGPILKSTNINHTCPLQQDIIFQDLIIDEHILSEVPAPNGNYIFQFRVSAFEKWKADVKFYAKKV